jgi:AcrR family transcriptional regulator
MVPAEHDTAQEPRWRRIPEERPRQILDAALAEFGERGLSGARLDDIARRAGVSKGTIYLYFPNKEELFRELIRQTVGEMLAQQERDVGGGSASDQIRAYAANFWRFVHATDYAKIFRLVIGELHKFPDLSRFYSEEVATRASRIVSGIIARGVAAGEFRPVDPVVAARILSALITSHAFWCSSPGSYPHLQGHDEAKVRAEVEDFFLHALRPLPSRTTDGPAPRTDS